MFGGKNNCFAIGLYLDVKFIKDEKIYFSINKKAESLLRQFASALFSAVFDANTTCKDVAGATFTPRKSSSNTLTFMFASGYGNTYIVLSTDTSDQSLTFDDYKLNSFASGLSLLSGYPVYTLETGSDYSQFRIQQKWTYSGLDTFITASALYYHKVYDTSGNAHQVMIAKDVFNPALQLKQNSLIDWSYIIRISL